MVNDLFFLNKYWFGEWIGSQYEPYTVIQRQKLECVLPVVFLEKLRMNQ